MINRRDFGKLAVVGSAMGMLPAALRSSTTDRGRTGKQSGRSPNLLYIFPDQYRLQALGIWSKRDYRKALQGNSDPVVTPALDNLARESVLFTQATSTYPLCSPYRGMFMSGMYPANNGVENNCRMDRLDSLRHDVDCLTDVLFKSGYETAYIGKTHWEQNENLFDESENYIGNRKPPGGHHMNQYDTYIPEGRGRHGNRYWFQCVRDVHKDPRVFTSDHGEMMGSQGLMGKNYIYEESFLVPFMIRAPGKLEHRLEDLMLMPVDIMPTLLGLLGLGDSIPQTAEGVNYAHALETGDFSGSPKPRSVPYIGLNKRGIRSYRYSLEIAEDGSVQLFDNSEDPYQMTCLRLQDLPERDKQALLNDLGRWLREMNDSWYHQRLHADLIGYPT